MEMHQLRYVVMVSRAGHSSRAAEQFHVSQPPPGQQSSVFAKKIFSWILINRRKLTIMGSPVS